MTRSQSTVDPVPALSLHTSTVNVSVFSPQCFCALAASFSTKMGLCCLPTPVFFLATYRHFSNSTGISGSQLSYLTQTYFKACLNISWFGVNQRLQAVAKVLADDDCFDSSDDMNLNESQ